MATKQNVYGEGNYQATRDYNDATKKFIESGKVDEAARDAAPDSPQEAAEMKQAEQAALLRAKGSPAPIKEPPPADPALEASGRATKKARKSKSNEQAD